MKKFLLGFLIFYLFYAAGISVYLLNLEPGYVPAEYAGTSADPKQFMTEKEIEEAHHLDLIHYFRFFLQTPLDVILVLFFMMISVKLRNRATGRFRKSFWQVSYYYFFFSTALTLLYLPLEFFFYKLSRDYGLSNQSSASWLGDMGIGFGLDLVMGILLIWLLFFAIKKFPKKWWLAAWAASLPLTILLMFIAPVFIAPLFNDYKPLENEKAKAEIQQLADEAGISDAKILEMNMSKQTNTINAFVNGFGSNMQIVLGDTAINELTVDEIKFVMAHEIAHYKMDHIYKGLVLQVIVGFFTAFATFRLFNWMRKKWGHRWGIKDQHDIAVLPLLMISFSIISFLASPIGQFQSRLYEVEADRYAIEVTADREAAITAFQKLTKNVKSTGYEPAIIHFIMGSHPRMTERIDFLDKYDVSNSDKTD
ncbi:M48 family metallopeptidase [Domibacillus sp. A3M-37]|uniref:M48 family metallopeptidase n=1 Tax=Domibacillus sp. A3M-37 TaxID=2962037 RepID=UPI0020B883E8|nr:M48 family metallopeptidase [Domibacillus sp. A3M-37]MCP3761701.1 M48 family metallopeptidase [Domibacillus sp. A3M-37]